MSSIPSPTPTPPAPPKKPAQTTHTRYEDRSKDDLLKLAAEQDIEGRSSMSKTQLVAALRGGTVTATAPAKTPRREKIELIGVYDADAGSVAYLYEYLPTLSDQKDAAENQILRLLEHVGEGASRDLRVVKVIEV